MSAEELHKDVLVFLDNWWKQREVAGTKKRCDSASDQQKEHVGDSSPSLLIPSTLVPGLRLAIDLASQALGPTHDDLKRIGYGHYIERLQAVGTLLHDGLNNPASLAAAYERIREVRQATGVGSSKLAALMIREVLVLRLCSASGGGRVE